MSSSQNEEVLPVGICKHRNGFQVRKGDVHVGWAKSARGAKRKLAEHLEVPAASLQRKAQVGAPTNAATP